MRFVALVAVACSACLTKPSAPVGCGEWGAVQTDVFANVNTTNNNESGPWLSADGLELFYASTGGGGPRIFRSVRASSDAKFPAGSAVTVTPAPDYEAAPFVSDDRLTMWYATLNPSDLVVAMRTDATSTDFGTAAPLADANSSSSDRDPEVLADGSQLLFASDRNGTFDILAAPRAGSSFGIPHVVAGLDTARTERSPTASADGRELIVAIDGELVSLSGDPATLVYSDETPIPATTDGLSYGDPHLSRDGSVLVFSFQNPESQTRDLAYVRRNCAN